ncbi:MAG: 16S rRNA (uracil(1498)-N(3))-methyltransferase [Flavobacteriales bacterium]|nr:16S rRNA (uracil(1498)-N(3))-methyltransferase [Flavobacteriales bacterium]
MHIFYTPTLSANATTHVLDKDESHHCIKVLRLGQGDVIKTIDGKGAFYTAKIIGAHAKNCEIQITESIQNYGKRDYHLHIAIAPTKNMSRIEWFVEKATECGIDEISFIQCNHSERNHFNTKRLHKILLSAVKQSQQAYLPKINEIVPAEQFLRTERKGQRFIASCLYMKDLKLSKKYKNGDVTILIGPEGDFSPEELKIASDQGYEAISLGKTRLRTETAAIVASYSINLLHE